MEPFYSYSFSTTHSSKIADQNPRVKRPFQSSKLPCRIYLCPVSRACMFCAPQTNQISEQARESWARARADLDK